MLRRPFRVWVGTKILHALCCSAAFSVSTGSSRVQSYKTPCSSPLSPYPHRFMVESKLFGDTRNFFMEDIIPHGSGTFINRHA